MSRASGRFCWIWRNRRVHCAKCCWRDFTKAIRIRLHTSYATQILPRELEGAEIVRSQEVIRSIHGCSQVRLDAHNGTRWALLRVRGTVSRLAGQLRIAFLPSALSALGFYVV